MIIRGDHSMEEADGELICTRNPYTIPFQTFANIQEYSDGVVVCC